jgi:hypothetical protein
VGDRKLVVWRYFLETVRSGSGRTREG